MSVAMMLPPKIGVQHRCRPDRFPWAAFVRDLPRAPLIDRSRLSAVYALLLRGDIRYIGQSVDVSSRVGFHHSEMQERLNWLDRAAGAGDVDRDIRAAEKAYDVAFQRWRTKALVRVKSDDADARASFSHHEASRAVRARLTLLYETRRHVALQARHRARLAVKAFDDALYLPCPVELLDAVEAILLYVVRPPGGGVASRTAMTREAAVWLSDATGMDYWEMLTEEALEAAPRCAALTRAARKRAGMV